jgi:hypothetical protein
MADYTRPGPSQAGLVLLGAVTACLAAFPAAGLVALVYGFPIPFHAKLQGPAAVSPAMKAVIFYGILGGFPVLAGAGAAAAAIARSRANGDAKRARVLTVWLSLAAALIGAIGLAVLDLFIGQW